MPRPAQLTFLRMKTENFFALFPRIPRLPGKIEREATEYGILHVPDRGWDPCAIDCDTPYAIFFQDCRDPKWNRITFNGSNAVELKME